MGVPTHRSCHFYFAALGIILLTVAIRLPSLLHPQPIDSEAMYSVVANEIVDGGRPYADAVERKPPLLFWTYAAVFKIAGKFNWKALHIVALVWALCATAGLYVIGRELVDRNTGLIAALFYGVFQPFWWWKNLSFDAEMLMNLPIIWAWAIAFRRGSSRLRALCGRCVSGRGFPAQTTGCDRSSSARHLSTSPQLSSQPQFDANEFDYSGSHAHGRIFRSAGSRDDCALEARHPS